MEKWIDANKKLLKSLQEKYGNNSLNIPMFTLQEFDYINKEALQNKKMKAISRFKGKNILIENRDHLSGCFDGDNMHCFYRTIISNEDTRDFEMVLKKYDILYEKQDYRENSCYACDIAKINLQSIKNIIPYSSNKSVIGNMLEEISESLTQKIL